MKNVLTAILSLTVLFTLSACAGNTADSESSPHASSQPVSPTASNSSGASTNPDNTAEPANGSNTARKNAKIKMTIDGKEIIATMYDNPTSRDFLTQLPLSLTFEDYNGIEKISYLPHDLTTEDSPEGFDPSIGDVALYAPWGNLSIFYQDFSYSRGLISLGHIDSGLEALANMSGDFAVTIEAVK